MDEERPLRKKASLALILGGIFAVALFIRAFFALDLALRDFLLSGGSDAFYYGWLIENVVATGKQLAFDEMLNFPLGMRNPRPPLYSWSVALIGGLVGRLQGNLHDGVWQTFLFSTAVWGALTVFPTYFLAKEMFGRRTAIVAAFFLAILPAHLQRTPLSNGDHDAMVLFFVVTAFYFFLRALGELKEKTWVESWVRPRGIYGGLRTLVTENRKTILLSVMAGTSLATVALIWTGWAYAVVILVVYFLAQLVVHKIRNQDPLGILLAFSVTLGTAHLLAAPYYLIMNLVRTWFDVPLLLFLASVGLAFLFAFFHRLPWMLVIPPVVLGFTVGTAIAAIYSPAVAAAVASGAGYFIRSKAFETIAEAQAPILSQVILSFGAVTFYLSLAGIALMVIQSVRGPRPDFLFILAWTMTAVFMALSAVRFIFNASPAFAITSAWVVVLIVERLGLEKVGRAIAATGGSRLGALRKGIRVRHVAGVLLITFLVVLPNTWYAVDAGSPFEVKPELEEQVLRVTPDFLRPPQAGQGLFYFGAFGFSLPLPNRYFPQAWSWLQEQDADVVPFWERPAFLSWWDYGFESIQEARHPTVADNFLNGLEFAGHFLTSQSENEGIAVLNVRLLLGDHALHRGQLGPVATDGLVAAGLDPDHVVEVLQRPGRIIPLIRSEPERFGEWDTRISGDNARIIYLRTILTEAMDLDAQAEFYRDLRTATGFSVGYFAVDSRLIPFSGTNTGIFYAVVKLTDHRTTELPDGRSIPVDFYRLIAATPQGEFDLDKVPPAAQIQSIRIEYLDSWYNSMAYRIFFGPSGEALGRENDGLPGLTGGLVSVQPQHGWRLEHFQLAYRTAYFSPHPPEEAANFSEDFTATNIFDALELQRQINAGEIEGTVDLTARSALQQGIVILRYYDGAILRGQVTTDAGTPMAGVRVTTLDSLSTPHEVAFTDDRGFYQALLPFGEARVVVSTGLADNTTGTGTILDEATFDISAAQALRLPLDEEGTGLPSFIMEHSFVVRGAGFLGTAFMDLNGDGQRDPGERGLEDLEVAVRDIEGDAPDGMTRTGPGGAYDLGDLLPTRYRLSLMRLGQEVAGRNASLTQGQERGEDLAVRGASLAGSLTDEFGQPVASATISLIEEAMGTVSSMVTGDNGSYRFEGLFAGNYTLGVEAGARGAPPQRVALVAGRQANVDVRVEPQGELTGRTLLSFVPTPHVTLTLQRRGEANPLMITSDASARFAAALAQDTYHAYALHFSGGRTHVFLGAVAVGPGTQALDVNLLPAHRVEGNVALEVGGGAQAGVTFEQAGALHVLTTGPDGSFVTFLPAGQYVMSALSTAGQFVSPIAVQGPTLLDVTLSPSVRTTGRVFRDLNGNGTVDPGEGLAAVGIRVETPSVPPFSIVTQVEGAFSVPLLASESYVWVVEERGFAPVRIGPLPVDELRSLGPIELVADLVPVVGRLTSFDQTLNLEGVDLAVEAVGDGAVSQTATTGPGGAFSALLPPGIYRLVVDADAPPGDGSRRIQGLEERELRVPIGGTVDSQSLAVVERVRVRGTIDTGGDPVPVAVLFDGPDRREVLVDGPYLVHLQRGVYHVSGTSTTPTPTALLASVPVPGPRNFTAAFQPAFTLTGALRVDGSVVQPDASIAFTREDTGARVGVPSQGSGSYRATLLPGAYRATSEWVGVDRLEGGARFVRYVLDQPVVVSDDRAVDLLFARELDRTSVLVRVLLGGQFVAARLTFQAANETALTTGLDVPAGSPAIVELTPGVYHLYAFREIGRSVGLSQIKVLPTLPNEATVRLEQGLRVSGVASLSDGSRRAAELRFTSSVASANFTSDAQGGFEVFLPPGPYDVQATAQRQEAGVAVEYRFDGSLSLADSALLNPLLSRVDVRTLGLAWDPVQRTLIAPGDTAVYTVTVTNTGNREDAYAFEGFPRDWAFDFQPSRMVLPFGTGNEAGVTVRITAPEDARVAHDPLTVFARSASDPAVSSSVGVAVDILQVRGLSLGLGEAPPVLDPEALRYQVEVRNDGNGDDTFDLVLTNPEALAAQGWKAELLFEDQTSPDTITGIFVGAGASQAVTLRLEAVGRVSTSTATFLASSQEERTLESVLDVPLAFPSLQIPRDQLVVEGKNVRLGLPEFPILLYGALAAGGIGLTVLVLTYGRRRRRR